MAEKVHLSQTIQKLIDAIICDKCGNSVSKLDYARHLRIHKEKKAITCTICFKKFTNLSNFKYHMSHHSDERSWICNECPKSYKTKTDLVQHKRVHEKASGPFNCEECSEQFTIRSKYNTHVRNYHTVKGPKMCEICNNMFVNIRSHIKEVHERIRRHKCTVCSKEFGKKSGLIRHITTVHEKLKSWLCDICNKGFGEKGQLLKHRKVHSNDKKMEKEILKERNNERICTKYIKKEMNSASSSQDDNNKNQNEEFQNESYIFINSEEIIPLEKGREDDIIEVLDEFRDLVYTELNKEYKCHICSFTFKQKRYYQSHIHTVHNKDDRKPLDCHYCSEKFTHRTQRLRHTRQKHPEIYEENPLVFPINNEDVKNRTCGLCNKIFKKANYLQIHAASVHNAEHFECDLCHRKFTFKKSMERHIRAIHENRRDFKCLEILCGKAFRSRYELNEHFKNIHSREIERKTDENSTCDICEKVCTSKKTLYMHKKLVHEKVKWNSKFECKLCKESFNTRYKKIKHFHQIHRNGEVKVRSCHFCSSHFTFFDDFKAHIESHVDCFICIICGHNFPDDSALFIHKESHKKIEEEFRQFICDICSHRLSTKSQLEVHMRKHSTNKNYYICDECGKTYKFQAPFLHHKLVHHSNSLKFKCSYCSKSFRKMRDKNLHERIHSGQRPYKCHVCKKTFVQKQHYSNHMKIHHTKHFECKVCHFHQSSLAKLRLHEIHEHPEEFPFKCLDCGSMFKVSHTFEDHKTKCVEK